MATKEARGGVRDGTALVVGGAACVWDDLTIALREYRPALVFVVNDIGTVYSDRIDFWVSLHPEKLLNWQTLRRQNGLNDDYLTYTYEPCQPGLVPGGDPRVDKWLDYRYPGMTGSGSSGLLAVKAAQAEGCDRIVLAGVPLTTKERHFFSRDLWHERDQFAEAWKIAYPHLRDSVRSLSGWTKELLGSPTPTWFAGGDH